MKHSKCKNAAVLGHLVDEGKVSVPEAGVHN